MSEKRNIKGMTPVFRVAFPSVLKSRYNELSKKDEFTVTALFKKGEDLSKLRELALNAAINKWGPDKSKWPKDMMDPFKDQSEFKKQGAENLYDGAEPGAKMLRLKSYQAPGVIDNQKNEILEEKDFYGGCFARATVSASAYDQGKNRGVSFWLNNIQKVKEGDPLGGRTRPQDDFEAIEELSEGASGDSLFN